MDGVRHRGSGRSIGIAETPTIACTPDVGRGRRVVRGCDRRRDPRGTAAADHGVAAGRAVADHDSHRAGRLHDPAGSLRCAGDLAAARQDAFSHRRAGRAVSDAGVVRGHRGRAIRRRGSAARRHRDRRADLVHGGIGGVAHRPAEPRAPARRDRSCRFLVGAEPGADGRRPLDSRRRRAARSPVFRARCTRPCCRPPS